MKAKTESKPEVKEQKKHQCDICGISAVILHDSHYYCQPHYSIRLESVRHEQVVERHKKGDDKPRALIG
jgi:hypothetical protein